MGVTHEGEWALHALILDEADLIREIAESRTCNRCCDPSRSVAGLVIFPTTSQSGFTLSSIDWALCPACLSSLKGHGQRVGAILVGPQE